MTPEQHETEQLQLEIARSKIRQARAQTPEQRLRAGIQLFGRMRRTMISGIRSQFPDADDEEVERIFRERLALSKKIQNANL